MLDNFKAPLLSLVFLLTGCPIFMDNPAFDPHADTGDTGDGSSTEGSPDTSDGDGDGDSGDGDGDSSGDGDGDGDPTGDGDGDSGDGDGDGDGDGEPGDGDGDPSGDGDGDGDNLDCDPGMSAELISLSFPNCIPQPCQADWCCVPETPMGSAANIDNVNQASVEVLGPNGGVFFDFQNQGSEDPFYFPIDPGTFDFYTGPAPHQFTVQVIGWCGQVGNGVWQLEFYTDPNLGDVVDPVVTIIFANPEDGWNLWMKWWDPADGGWRQKPLKHQPDPNN